MSEKITKIHYNWRECGERADQWGEDYDIYTVGNPVAGISVTKIEMNDRNQAWVYFYNGDRILQGNLNAVFFSTEE